MADMEMDDSWKYEGYRMGRATRTAEVAAPDGSKTIEKGTITFDPINREDTWCWEEDHWVDNYMAPDGHDGVLPVVGVGRDLVGIIEFPEPMTEKEAWEWLDENPSEWRRHLDDEITSDTTAADLGISNL